MNLLTTGALAAVGASLLYKIYGAERIPPHPELHRQQTVTLPNGKVIHREIPNDVFDRQRCILDWNQMHLENQECLLLGVGGLGCTIAMILARLGVKKMYLIDKDVVEASNLNRQVLFSKTSIGKRKVDAAVEGLQPHLVGDTELVPIHMDVAEHWDEVVKLASRCSVIFNNVDIGAYFDYAVLSLAKSLSIPYVAGSSYATTWIVEYYNGKKGYSSFSLDNKDGKKEIFDALHPSKIQDLKNLTFLPKDSNPPTRWIGSNALVCCSAGIMTTNAWVQAMMGNNPPNYTKFDIVQFWEKDDTIAWPPPMDPEFSDLASPASATPAPQSSSK